MTDPIPFRERPKDHAEPQAPPRRDDRVYTNEEVTEIIRIALGQRATGDQDTVNREELLTIAKDFGLSGDDVDEAQRKISQSREVEERTRFARLWFKVHGIAYGVVILGLALINYLTNPVDTYWWVLFPAVAWGVVVALHGVLVMYLPEFAGWILGTSSGPQGRSRNRGPATGEEARAAFTINELYFDLAEAKGIARVHDGCFHLEFQIADTVFGTFKSGVREIRVPLEEIAHVKLERRMWCNKLRIQGHRIRTFDDVPKSHGGEICLIFKKPALPASERLAEDLIAAIEAVSK